MANLQTKEIVARYPSDYWRLQVYLKQKKQSAGIRVGVRDRLPLFRLWLIVDRRITGARKYNILHVMDQLVALRKAGREPPHDGNKYT